MQNACKKPSEVSLDDNSTLMLVQPQKIVVVDQRRIAHCAKHAVRAMIREEQQKLHSNLNLI